MSSDEHQSACREKIVTAKCRRCGKLVADYWAHRPNCPTCTTADDEGWRRARRCQCDPPPVLPDGSSLVANIAVTNSDRLQRFFSVSPVWHRAWRTIRI